MAESLDVVWVAPETIDRARGQYREYLGQEEHTFASAPTGPAGEETEIKFVQDRYGDLCQWVNTSPDDGEDPSGYFRRYDGSEADYVPVVTEGEAQEENGE